MSTWYGACISFAWTSGLKRLAALVQRRRRILASLKVRVNRFAKF